MHRFTTVVAVLFVHGALAQTPQVLELGVGMQKVIEVPGLERVAVGDEQIMDVKPIGKSELLLIGISPGRTSLITWAKKGQRTAWDVEVRAQGATAKAGAAPNATIALREAELRLLDVPKVQRATTDAPSVLDVKVIDEGHVLVTGLAPGKAKLTTVSAGGLKVETIVSVSEATQAVDAGEQSLVVKRGASIELAAPNLQRVAIGDSDTADVDATPKGLVIKGLKPGVTTLLLWHADGRRTAYQVVVQP